MATKKPNSIVRGFFERVSWKVLDKYRPIVKQMIRGHAGVYALYKGERLYYIGLASNLMGRVNHHLKDRHAGKWDRFSVYLTTENAHIRPLEALMLRVINPAGNRVTGRLTGAQDMVRQLKRKMDDSQRNETASLLGGRFVTHRRRSKTRSSKGTLVLSGLVERSMRLVANYKGERYTASLRRDGHISYKGKLYDSPSSVAKVVIGRAANGWQFWTYRKGKAWVRLAELRR
ncbi:MAG: DUF2924 domain-containing protein [Rhodocyclaceae bacterium]|nr:DUF2924 domain-containing protein [Rhodocyclaceae bacterium]